MTVQNLTRKGKPALAYVHSAPSGNQPQLVFCGGYRSDMNGTKACYLEQQCAARGQGFVRFDYSGHGLSEGRFEDGTMGAWRQDALDIIDHIPAGPLVLVGSSMGGWIALLSALSRPERVQGLVGIAAAPDFTEELYEDRLSPAQQKLFLKQGFIDIPNDYSDEPYHFTRDFYEEGKQHLLLDRVHDLALPIRLLQGRQDKDVPWQTAEKIRAAFKDVKITYIDDGDHRLSRPEDLEAIDRVVKSVSGY